MMRATTLKAGGTGLTSLVGYYAGLAEDQLRRDGRSRGPIDYYLDPNEPPGRWWGRGCPAVELSGDVRPEQLAAMLQARHPGHGRRLLSARLSVSWGQLREGHADIEGVPAELLDVFSQRHVQVDARMAELVAAWVDDHDGAEPDPRTLYRLERKAVLDTRPGKSEPTDADQLRGEWLFRAQAAGFESLALSDGPPD